MKFVCDRCHTKYSIADEKVRGKILKVRCKSCSNVITVREAPAAAAAHPEATEFDEESSRTVIVPSVPDHVAAVNRAAAGNRPSGAMSTVGSAPPPAPAPADDVQWFLALSGVQKGPFSRKGLVDKLVAMPRDADVHVWNEKLDGWKPPKDVAVIERELQARRRQAAAPPPPPGMRPRAPTGPQPLAAAPPRRTTGAHALPGPLGSVAASPAATATGHAPGIGTAEHPPAPAPAHPQRTRRPTNGVVAAHAGGTPVAPLTGESDALNALNLKQGTSASPANHHDHQHEAGHAPVPALDLGTGGLSDVVGSGVPWQAPSVPTVSAFPTSSMAIVPRQRNARLIVGFLGIVAVIVVIVTFSLIKKPAPVVVDKAKVTSPEQGFAAMADKLEQEQKQAATAPSPPVAVEPVVVPTVPSGKPPTVATVKPTKPVRRTNVRGGRVPAGRGGKAGVAGGAAETAADPTASRFADSSGRTLNVQGGGGGGARSTPSQSDISRVISNNKAGIKICYQRALLRDSSLTHGKIAVRVSIGLSGRAKSVHVDGPTPFRALEPCIRDVLSRWAFPPSSEEYGTEFSYVFQGNE